MTATLPPDTKAPSTSDPSTQAAVQEAILKARDAAVQVVDVRFTDLLGTWQHFSIPVRHFTEELFNGGIGFDGSSIRGFQSIHESDMLLMPDATTAFIDPCLQVPTLSIMCNVVDPLTLETYSRCPRNVAKKAEQYLLDSGVATAVRRISFSCAERNERGRVSRNLRQP